MKEVFRCVFVLRDLSKALARSSLESIDMIFSLYWPFCSICWMLGDNAHTLAYQFAAYCLATVLD